MSQPPHVQPPDPLETGEFDRHDAAAQAAARHLGFAGWCYGSMSAYRERYPEHLTIKNANICTKEHGKIWWGDLDVTANVDELRALARELGVTVWVLRESAARFRTAHAPEFHEASYATDWHEDGFVPTLAWAVAEGRRRNAAALRQARGD